MIAEKMKPFVQNNSAIRMMFEEGNCLRAKYGADKVYDFSLGNPSVPAPDCVREAIIDLVNNEEPTVLHGYMNNAGFEDVRETIAQSLNRRFALLRLEACSSFTGMVAENFGRFFHLSTPDIHYNLGHENGVWYNFMTLAAGFVPWTIFFFFSLFGLKLHKPEKSVKEILANTWNNIRSMEKEKLFSLVALVCIIFFYSIPSSKRSVYLMPAYCMQM